MADADVIEAVALAIYADSYTQYGTCNERHWRETSEVQREFCRGQAVAAILTLRRLGMTGL